MRINSIDILRGIGIILVVLGHAPIDKNVLEYIYNFHMPLFFFISGYLFNLNQDKKFNNFFSNKFKGLIKVYFYSYIVSIAIWIMFNIIQFGDFNIDLNIVVKEFILAKRNQIRFNGALWFLPALFVTEVTFYTLKKILKLDVWVLVITIYLSYVGLLKYKTMASVNTLPFTLDAVMWLIFFYNIGYLVKKYLSNFEVKNAYKWSSVVLGIPSFILLINLNKYYSIIDYFYGIGAIKLKFTFVILTQISGILFYYGIALILKKCSILEYIGRKSVFAFTLHLPLVWPLLDIIFKKINYDQFNNLILTSSIYVIISLIITLGVEKAYKYMKMGFFSNNKNGG